MDKLEKLEKFYTDVHDFKNGIAELRKLALDCGLIETYKWSFPTYTFENKNIIAICKFKVDFGIWFFNGVFLKDPKRVLKNAQEGKTKAMRQWKFLSQQEIDKKGVVDYINEAIENHKKGLELKLTKKPKEKIIIPTHLISEFKKNKELKDVFYNLTHYKQKEYAEYIDLAKQEKTKQLRISKIIPLILDGKGLNDFYRK
ncbi:YdeI/OmpD-associated family protein [uncultured Maribacter sp.]|uniref:YdeI/OmpD-associated family protein n=1 Tax=uncultured Maribacter sp. TaxID=431308 RepID=UPI0030D9F576|tara:strand:+ start:293 stop:892 length:600 start_codon:yes stop_codon:yes gene_type:complete